MRKILLMFAVLAAMVFTGCSKDDNGNNGGNGGGEPAGEIELEGYEEPIVDWGISKQELKSRVTYTLLNEDETTLSYAGKNKVSMYTYSFENGKLDVSGAFISTAYNEELADFINKKYIYVNDIVSGEDRLFDVRNKENTMLVTVGIPSTQYLLIMYSPRNSTANNTFLIQASKSLMNAEGGDCSEIIKLFQANISKN